VVRRTIHLEPVGGIAGDMFVAAMLDALPELRERVLRDAEAVLPASFGKSHLSEGASAGIRALRFGLRPADDAARGGDRGGARAHGPGHGHSHEREDRHGAAAGSAGAAASMSFAGLLARIRGKSLTPGTADHAAAILTILAEAEARIHGVALGDVHFHEIADWDSLLDVVAAGSIAGALDGVRWSVASLPRGGGLVRTEHGMLPVPAPATAAILQDFTWRDDGIDGERVTPTGAAILRHLVRPGHAAPSAGRLAATGYGAGTRELPSMPNVLRALVFDEVSAESADNRVAVLDFDIDDMTGEEIALACDRLRVAEGVLDVSTALRVGKKGRLLHAVRLLVSVDARLLVTELCFSETSTIGLMWRIEERVVLPRRVETSGLTPGLRHKSVERPGGRRTAKVESDDLAQIPSLAERRAAAARAIEGASPDQAPDRVTQPS
jgi:pyridinium-3,5-bisthiocarboxylic acid mononucleotide nickel chelatase